jgi:putative FmdB family regulatory protein
MPLYEYYCRDCDGVFELLRPPREAAKAQPCPVCDDDAERIMSKQWAAFIFRDGYPRRIPDDGSHWHLGKKVSKPISEATEPYVHPELRPRDATPAATIEDLERFEAMTDARRSQTLEWGGALDDKTNAGSEQAMLKKIRRRATPRVEQEKHRIMRKIASEEVKTAYVTRRERDARIRATPKRKD